MIPNIETTMSGKRFGEAFIKADVEAFASCPRAGFLQQMRRHVQRGHRGPPMSQWEGHVARATGDIQHTDVRFKCQPSDEALGVGRANGFGYCLITNANLLGCSTGRSGGFAPLGTLRPDDNL
jgi:hypothetical protein